MAPSGCVCSVSEDALVGGGANMDCGWYTRAHWLWADAQPVAQLAQVVQMCAHVTGNGMKHATLKRKTRRTESIVGIVKDAATLGVTRVHLYLVLTGKRPSASLKSRYFALQKLKHTAALENLH